MLAFIANKLSLEGYDVCLLTYDDMDTEQLLSPEIHRVPFNYSPPQVFGLRRIFQVIYIRKVINQIKPDLLMSFLPYPNIITIISSIGTGIPVIISIRNDPYAHPSWFTKLRDFVYQFAYGFIFQTNGARNYFKEEIRARSTVIPNPVTVETIQEKWSGKREDFIVTLGRFDMEDKRHDILIQAFSRIAGKYPNIKLILYGNGKDESKIKHIISDCNLENRVILPGVTRNVYESIKKARMFVLSSDHEGIPNALIEAMSVGLPCISTDCSPGGAAGLIKNMENGILVKAGCIDELANAMEFILNHPQKAESMGENARKIITDLDPDEIIQQWKNYIHHLIKAKSLHR